MKSIISRVITIFILLFLFIPIPGIAVETEILQVEQISTLQGLSSPNVTCITQDSIGYLWIGTKNGLNRYDGYTFDIYKYNTEDSTSISCNSICCLYIDRQGTLWIGTEFGGLNRYDPASNSFQRFTFYTENGDTVSKILSLKEDHSGKLWMTAHRNGLISFNPKTGVYKSIKERFRLSEPYETLQFAILYDLEVDKRGILWIASGPQSLIRYDPEIDSIYYFIKRFGQNYRHILRIHQYQNQEIWLASPDGILIYTINTDSNRFIKFFEEGVLKLPNRVTDLIKNNQNDFWVATYSKDYPITKLDQSTQKKHIYQLVTTHNNEILYTKINYFFIDQSDAIWMGTIGAGLLKITQVNKSFQHLNQSTNPEFFPSGDDIICVFADEESIWYAASDNQIYKYNTNKRNTVLIKRQCPQIDMGKDNVNAIFKDSRKRIWIGSSYNLYLFNPDSLNLVPIDYSNLKPVRYFNVKTIYEDSMGAIWLGTNGSGLVHCSPDNFRLSQYFAESATNPGITIGNPAGGIYAIHEDSNQNLWIATVADGVKIFDREQKIFSKSYYNKINDSFTISDNRVKAIFESSDGTLWFGTVKGLNIYDPKLDKIYPAPGSHRLVSDHIVSIFEDNEQKLWLIEYRGISYFDREAKIWINFTTQHGVEHYRNRLSYVIANSLEGDNIEKTRSFCRLASGAVIVGGINGITYFFPDSITNIIKKPVVIRDFRLFGESISFPKPIWQTDTLQLHYNENYFSFDFFLPDYRNPQKNEYSYMLENLDEDWSIPNFSNTASYANVPPGNYIFKVRGINTDGSYTQDATMLHIVVIPPFWQLWWFRILMIIMGIGLIAGIVSLRVSQIKAQRDKLEIEVAERTKEISQINRQLVEEVKVRRTTETNFRISEEKYRGLFENSNDVIWTADKTGNILSINRYGEELLEFSREELIGKSSFNGISNNKQKNEFKSLYARVTKGEQVECEINVKSKSGRNFIFWIKMRPLINREDIIGVHGTSRDITELKQAQEELKRTEKKKREGLKQLTLKIAHEIKNPLASIKSSTQLIAGIPELAQNPRKRRHLEVIDRNVDICDKVVRDLYDLSHLPKMNFKKLEIQELTNKINSYAQGKCEHTENINLRTKFTQKQIVLNADDFRLMQAFTNILDNAIDAMPEGGTLDLETSFISQLKEISIIIKDSGIGLTPEEIEMLFQPYYSTKASGFGLGLPLAKDIVEAHRGKIQVDSDKGKGTTFIVILPGYLQS
jgi:PAS domain S-box-containing protein